MIEEVDLHQILSYYTACETLAESRFSKMSSDRRARIATWCAAIMESLEGEQISNSDLHLILGSLAGLAVWEEKIPDGINKYDLRGHARNLMIGAFERGCDGIPTLD